MYPRASGSASAATLAAMLVLAAPVSASSIKRASVRTSRTAPTAVVSSARRRHRHHHRGQVAGACLNDNRSAASAATQAMRDAVLCLVNRERAAHGLPSLRASAQLTRSAQGWSDEMVASGTFSATMSATRTSLRNISRIMATRAIPTIRL